MNSGGKNVYRGILPGKIHINIKRLSYLFALSQTQSHTHTNIHAQALTLLAHFNVSTYYYTSSCVHIKWNFYDPYETVTLFLKIRC